MLRRAMLVIACLGFAWAVMLQIAGGFDATVLGLRIRSNNPYRVALIATLALVVFFVAGGRLSLPWRPVLQRIRRAGIVIAERPGWIAAALAAVTMTVGLLYSTRTAGASDVYGYMSQADLWLEGRLKVPQPWAADVPWPDKVWSFSPLGYRPAPGANEWAIVPTYSPGLPLLLAVAKRVAGQCGLLAVVPLLGGVAVLVTYGLGRRLGSPLAGLIAAWLLATSPAVLGVLMDPLSDVPAMAVWTLAFYCVLGRGWASALAAGLLASLAILIRPNLVVLAGPLGLWWFLRRDLATPGGWQWQTRVARAALYALGVLPSVVAVALLNNYLFGAPLASGYGQLGDLFAWTRVLPNLGSYVRWYADSQTPIALLGLAALAVPSRRLWPAAPDRSVFLVIGLYVATLWAQYASYLSFDSWGYLRFLLPSWPLLMLGTASALLAAARLTRFGAALVAIAIIAVGARQLSFAKRHGVFDQRQAARHDLIIGPLVRAHTEENSVVVALQRSGSLRYYGGRVTLRYDYLPRETLDRDVTWLKARGVGVYALLDEREIAEFRDRFSGQQTLAALDRPVLIYQPGSLVLFDLTRPPDASAFPVLVTKVPAEAPDCVPPASTPSLVLR